MDSKDVKAGDQFLHKLSKQRLIALGGAQTDGQFNARLWDVDAKALVGPVAVWLCEVEPAPTAVPAAAGKRGARHPGSPE